jgi:RNA polymerase sigma-70 factor, ECF subfamily
METTDRLERARPVSRADAASFHSLRPRLFAISSRLLRSTAEADDVVQDAWIRWQGTDRSQVRDTTAFLVTTTTRLAINVGQSARVRHEMHVFPALPETADATADPALIAERHDALAVAAQALLERLAPTECAAFVLREAFDYPYRRIGDVLGLTEANARQVVTRARAHLASEGHLPGRAPRDRRFVEAFVAAVQAEDLATLERLLAADARERVPAAA